MTQEQIKAKAKEYFPNDEFKQQIVIDAINWATKELEKENAELKEELTKKADTNHSLVEQMADLENENAELKEKYAKNITDCDICDTYYNSQLTKAKEIIKDLLGSENTSCEEEMFFEIRQKAEQFLKEVEK